MCQKLYIQYSKMTSIVSKASKHLRDTKVSGFSTPGMSALIYFGSFLWFAAMTGVDVVSLIMQEDDIVMAGFATLIVINVSMFVLQTVNILCYVFKFWPVTSLYWTCQLTAIGLLSGSVGYAFSSDENEDRITVLSVTLARLFAQCLFTSSQFAVTLEYLYRSSEKCPSRAVKTHVAPKSRSGLAAMRHSR
jgi:hypothetical protein